MGRFDEELGLCPPPPPLNDTQSFFLPSRCNFYYERDFYFLFLFFFVLLPNRLKHVYKTYRWGKRLDDVLEMGAGVLG